MNNFFQNQKFIQWIECEVIPLKTGMPIFISIYREKIFLQESYLVLKENEKLIPSSIISINNSLKSYITDTNLIIIIEKINIILSFVFTSLEDLQNFVSELNNSFNNNIKNYIYEEIDLYYLNELSIDIEVFNSLKIRYSNNLKDIKTFPNTAGIINNSLFHRSLWEKRILTLNSSYTTNFSPLKFSIITWNVASVKPHSIVLEEIIESFSCGNSPADIIFITLQEIDMGVVSVVSGNSKTSIKWSKIVIDAVNKSPIPFIILNESTLGGVYSSILIKRGNNFKINITDVQQIRLGTLGIAANKGAVIFHLLIGITKFCLIGCHLSPHTEHWNERNEQIKYLLHQIENSYDYLIFSGDLNYRCTLNYDETLNYIQGNNISKLLEFDQLLITKSKDKIINKLKEPIINFLPTYKFDKDSNIYDSSPKHRVPSWTDRILIKRGKKRLSVGLLENPVFDLNTNLKFNFPKIPNCLSYKSGKCQFSDHRSVTGSFIFQIPILNLEKVNNLYDKILHFYDQIHEESKPCLISNKIKLNLIKEDSFLLKNTTKSLVKWYINDINGLKFSRKQGTLYPNNEELIFVNKNNDINLKFLKIEIENGIPLFLEIENIIVEKENIDLIIFD